MAAAGRHFLIGPLAQRAKAGNADAASETDWEIMIAQQSSETRNKDASAALRHFRAAQGTVM